MSCNQSLYEQEEQACRDTFLKDAEGAGIPYYFYKSSLKAEKPSIDEESHTMLLPVFDGLGGTAEKTTMAFMEALKMDGWDYLLKTNVSTWLDIPKIMQAINKWEGREDKNIYGAKFLANDASRNVPFPRGHFTILSRSMIEGITPWALKFIKADSLPKTDDTFISLSALYYLQKVLEDSYLKHLMEVPSVNCWTEEIQEAPEWTDALSVRCKNEAEREKTPDNIRKAHNLKHDNNTIKTYRRPMDVIETKYGTMKYGAFGSLLEKMDELKKRIKEQNSSGQSLD